MRLHTCIRLSNRAPCLTWCAGCRIDDREQAAVRGRLRVGGVGQGLPAGLQGTKEGSRNSHGEEKQVQHERESTPSAVCSTCTRTVENSVHRVTSDRSHGELQ